MCTVPEYHNKYRGGTVSVTVRCGQKLSHPNTFVYLPTGEFFFGNVFYKYLCEGFQEFKVVPYYFLCCPTIF